MDSVRAFKTLARQRLKEQRTLLAESRSLQKTQHLVAQDAGFTNWAALRSADDFERRLALLMHDWPQLTSVGLDVMSRQVVESADGCGSDCGVVPVMIV
ncbi:hypothetical protein, partial [uncultured Microbacterium sp.]|uniref:hypothetical protein n=1 Tax=uncultured Microbacterium sp. TaxID=191216 RepID=UPI00260A3F8A